MTNAKRWGWIIAIGILLASRLGGEEIRIFGNESRYPKIYLEGNEPKGILVDILRSMQKDLNATFHIELYPWLRAYALAKAGKGGIIGLSQNCQRLKLFDYSDVVIYDDISVVIDKKRPWRFETNSDLAGKRLGYCRGCSFGYRFEEAKRYFVPVEVDGEEFEGLQLLKKGRIDGYVLSQKDRSLTRLCKEHPQIECDEFRVLAKALTKDPNYLGFAKSLRRSEFLRRFNRVLKKRLEDGTIDRILQRYLRNDGDHASR